jgi:hypothetical protein
MARVLIVASEVPVTGARLALGPQSAGQADKLKQVSEM